MSEPVEFHKPVLYKQLQENVHFGPNAVLLDATIGHAGHAAQLAQQLGPDGTIIGLDVDPDCLGIAQKRLANLKCRVVLVQRNFGSLDQTLDELKIEKVDLILADLGVNSAQLDQPHRGFSFMHDGPLDMRLDPTLETNAADLVRRLPEKELADLIYNFGEERFSRRIAKTIVLNRKKTPITTTQQLTQLINQALGIRGPGRKSKIHPATRTFQALRIAVNDEFGQLKRLLDVAPNRLNENAAIAVISFHSLEDRIIKYNFRELARNEIYQIITKKPIQADDDEKKFNPRARSAKLRIAKRIQVV